MSGRSWRTCRESALCISRTWSILTIDRPRYTSPIAAGTQVFYAWDGLLAFEATAEKWNVHYDGKMNEAGLLASRDYHWKDIGLTEADKQELKKRAQFKKKIDPPRHPPRGITWDARRHARDRKWSRHATDHSRGLDVGEYHWTTTS